jgi:hypothetical protein
MKKEILEEVKDVLKEREEQKLANSLEARYWDKVYLEMWRRDMEENGYV